MTVFHDNETIRILNSLCDVSLNEFDDRLRLQKIAFLAQKMGSSGGFTFSWYRRGPYSPTLTQALYLCEQTGELGKKQRLTSNEKQVVKQIEKLIGESSVDNPRILELYASVWYLLPMWKVTNETIETVINKMKEDKPDYTTQEVKLAIEKIMNFRNQEISP